VARTLAEAEDLATAALPADELAHARSLGEAIPFGSLDAVESVLALPD